MVEGALCQCLGYPTLVNHAISTSIDTQVGVGVVFSITRVTHFEEHTTDRSVRQFGIDRLGVIPHVMSHIIGVRLPCECIDGVDITCYI